MHRKEGKLAQRTIPRTSVNRGSGEPKAELPRLRMKKLKVLILIPSLRRCGPVLGAVALAKHMNRESLEVTVGYLKKFQDPCPVREDLISSGIRIHHFDMPGWMSLYKIGRIRDYVCGQRIDILHSFGIRPDLINAKMSRICTTVASIRNIVRMEYEIKYGNVVSSIFTRVHFRALKKAQGIIAISRQMKSYLIAEGLPENRIAYIPNFVDFPEIYQFRKQWSPEHRDRQADRRHIGFFGNFNRIKRVDWVIDAVDLLIKREPGYSFTLHLVGDGPLKEAMQKRVADLGIQNSVRFYGYVQNVYEIMSRMDIVVLASKIEGIPRVFMEAMSLGKTCVGPDIGGINELIDGNGTGYLFPAGSFIDLADKLQCIVKENAFLDPRRLIDHIDVNFNASRIANLTVELYRRLLSGEPAEGAMQA
jgi:glycosyltransferase involved in cell wall biosynthesis